MKSTGRPSKWLRNRSELVVSSWGRAKRLTGRQTSWLPSTHVGGAPTASWLDSVRSIEARSAAGNHGHMRWLKLKAVCSSSGLR